MNGAQNWPRPGLRPGTEGAAAAVWAPEAKSIEILTLTNNRKHALTRDHYGYWTGTVPGLSVGDRYKVVIDGDQERPDPATLSQPEGVHGPSELVDLGRHRWTDSEWKAPELDDFIIYELHTGTFSEEGTFEGVIRHLDHLVELGVNAVEIMPVSQFPGGRNWGYDGVHLYAVQDSYGGPYALQALVDACHSRGLAVVLDVVYNHFGPEGNYLGDFGPYFTTKYSTPWGQAVNFDDAGCDAVRRFVIENALMWFRDFHIDALRLDAVHAIKDFSAIHILRAIREATDALMAQTGRTHYLIVELDLNDPRFLDPPAKNGFGMDAQWVDEFHHALRVAAGGSRSGYYSDFSGLPDLVKSFRDAYVYTGQYSEHRKRFFGLPAEGHDGGRFIVFSQNHDQVGNRMLGERTSELHSFEMNQVLAAAVLLSPFLPMLFMGEEWAEKAPFLYFVSHTDKELADAVRKGRKAEFEAFHLEGEAPDPVAEETFQRSKLDWSSRDGGPHAKMLAWYKELIRLRREVPALAHRSRSSLHAEEKEGMLVVSRWQGEAEAVIALNFNNRRGELRLPSHGRQWTKILDSRDSAAPQTVQGGGPGEGPLVVEPEAVLVYLKS